MPSLTTPHLFNALAETDDQFVNLPPVDEDLITQSPFPHNAVFWIANYTAMFALMALVAIVILWALELT